MSEEPAPLAVTNTFDAKRIRAALRNQYDRDHYALVEEVTYLDRRVDALAVSFWASDNHAVTGFEIKVSRGDWLQELKQPDKAQRFIPYCTQWYVVAPVGVVEKSELPKGWGLITVKASRTRKGQELDLCVFTRSARRCKTPEAVPPMLWATMLRQALKVSPLGTEFERGVREGIRRQLASDQRAMDRVRMEKNRIQNEESRMILEERYGKNFSRESLGLPKFEVQQKEGN